MPAPAPPTIAQLANLGYPVTSREFNWLDMVMRSWGSEFQAPDHGIYEFANSRRFDSTDLGTTGIYNPYATEGIMQDNAQYPDMPSYVLTDTSGYNLGQG